MRNPRFQPGDLIHWQGIVRRIDEVRSDGYVWSYPQYPAGADTPGGSPNTFLSVNSSDPEMTEWEKATTHPANGA